MESCGGGEWQKVEECEPIDNETGFDDEKPKCCHIYLVPEWLIRDEHHEVALYASMDTTSPFQQTLLLEGANIDSLQRGAYMGCCCSCQVIVERCWSQRTKQTHDRK